MRAPSIALDFTGLDRRGQGGGQYRYTVDLVRGLAELDTDARFLLLGCMPEPVPELRALFTGDGTRLRYRQVADRQGRAGQYLAQVSCSAVLLRERVGLLHALHTFVPLLAPCPVVQTVYDLMFELFPEYAAAARSRPYRIHRWSVLHRVRRVIAISQATAADLIRLWHVPPAKIAVVPLGTSFGAMPERRAVTPGAEALRSLEGVWPILATPYNLEPRKNLSTLLEAVARLRASFPGLRLLAFGHAAVTPERELIFERELAELGIAAAVVRTGYLEDVDLAWLYRRADAFVFPSLYEGFGLPLVEAMAVGCCVVARDASAMKEIVGDGGVLVDTRDREALQQSIAAVLRDGPRRAGLVSRARSRAGEFTIARMAEATHRVYLRALGRGGG